MSTMSVTRKSGPVVPSIPRAGRSRPSLKQFVPGGVAMMLDGGTIVMNGRLGKVAQVVVRYDGALDSPTRGSTFLTVGPKGSEKKLTAAQRHQLAAAVQQFLATNPQADQGYTFMVQQLLA